MKPENAKSRNSKILAEIKAANVRLRVVATFLHEDADAIEPAHIDVINKKEAPLSTAPGEVIAVVPAWEIETWWLMFPKAAKKVVRAWKTPTKYKNRPVGGVRHSKEELRVLLRQGLPGHPPVPEYRESHSPHFANAIVGNGLLDSPESSSASWNVFVERVMAL
jgi:hypothetical protein